MEKFCPKCGYKSDFKFCPNCGFNLSNIRLPGEQPSQPKESDLKRLFVENYPAYKQAVAYREEHSAPEKLSMENSPEQTSNDQDTNQFLREILSSLEHQPPQTEYISPAQELGSLDQLSPPESSPTFSTVPQSQEDTPAYPVGYNAPVVQEQIIQQDLSDHPSDINASETAQGVQNPCLSYNEHQRQASSGQETVPYEQTSPPNPLYARENHVYFSRSSSIPSTYVDKRIWLKRSNFPLAFFKFHRCIVFAFSFILIYPFFIQLYSLFDPESNFHFFLGESWIDSGNAPAGIYLTKLGILLFLIAAIIRGATFCLLKRIGYILNIITIILGSLLPIFSGLQILLTNPRTGPYQFSFYTIAYMCGYSLPMIPIYLLGCSLIWYYEKRRFLFDTSAELPQLVSTDETHVKLVSTQGIKRRIRTICILYLSAIAFFLLVYMLFLLGWV